MNEFHDRVKNNITCTQGAAVALPSRSRRNLSFALSNSIVVETDGRPIGVEEHEEDEDSMDLFEFEFELCTCK